MELHWTEGAAADLERIAGYLLERTPDHAPEIIGTLYAYPAALLNFPHRGRPGKKQTTRELVLSPLPSVVIYRISGEVIRIVRILHGAQNGPKMRDALTAPIGLGGYS